MPSKVLEDTGSQAELVTTLFYSKYEMENGI